MLWRGSSGKLYDGQEGRRLDERRRGIATTAAVVPASAAPALEPATSYAELIAPILNAAVILRADDAKRAEQTSEVGRARVYDAQYYYRRRRHYHHHHGYYR